MTKHYCDRCGKEMFRWYTAITDIEASNELVNVASLMYVNPKHEYCEECWKFWLESCKDRRPVT